MARQLSKKQLKQIIEHTPAELHGKPVGSSAMVEVLGIYTPHDCNWSYVAGWLDNGQLVVMDFGIIR